VSVGILYVLFAGRNLREIETSSALINGWTMRWINGRAMHAGITARGPGHHAKAKHGALEALGLVRSGLATEYDIL
jgi:hypothetical protein